MRSALDQRPIDRDISSPALRHVELRKRRAGLDPVGGELGRILKIALHRRRKIVDRNLLPVERKQLCITKLDVDNDV